MSKKTQKFGLLFLLLAFLIGVAVVVVPGHEAGADSGWKPGTELTAQNWGTMVGFKPDLSLAGIKAGLTISDSNYDTYKAAMPGTFETLIKKYKMRLNVVDYKPIHPSKGYIDATNKYAGQPKIVDVGNDVRARGLKDYTAGLPFPNPKTGLELAWNYHYSYNGDDGDLYYAVYWISASKGVETFEEWRWYYIMRTINRTDLEPIPAIPKFSSEGIQYTSITYCLSPYDKRGFGALFSRSVNPLNQQGHIYLPASKRVIRNSFGTRGDTWNGTDLLYEDVRGFMGYPEWMNWKLVEKKTLLMPMHAGISLGKEHVKKTFDMDNWPHWNPNMNWELRPTYVVETTPKLPDYPYSRMVFYYDAETFLIVYKEAYDKKGDLWKVILTGYNEPKDMNSAPPVYGMQLVIDLQAEHATAFPIYELKINTNLNVNEFTEANLRKRGR